MRRFVAALSLTTCVLACSTITSPSKNADTLLAGTWTADTADIHISFTLKPAGCIFDPSAGLAGETVCTSLGQGSFRVMTPAVTGDLLATATYDHVSGELPTLPYVQFTANQGGGASAGAGLHATMPDSSHLVGTIAPVTGIQAYAFGADSGVTLTFTRQ
jgi:hypothetical protein